MTRRRISFATSLILTLASASVANTTYYIDSVRGNDGDAGTSKTQAWRSLDRINQVTLGPGDSVLLAAGCVFDGQLKPLGEGAPGAPITIGMYGEGNPPRIDGHGRVEAVIHLRNTQHITVQDIHLTNYGEDRGDGRRGVLIELDNYGTAREIAVRRLRIDAINGSLIKKHSGAAIHFHNHGTRTRSRFDGLLIEENHITRSERNGITGSSAYVGRDNWYPSLNVVIRRNLLEEIPGDGIVPIGCDGALLEGNVVRNGTPLLRPEHSAAAGIWPWSCDNTVIQYNEVSRHRAQQDGQGFDADWNCRGTIIQYNYSHHNDGGFLLICNDGGSSPQWSAGNVGTVIRHNVSFNDGLREVDAATGPGHRAAAINVNGPVKDTEIYGNLIIAPRKLTDAVDNKLLITTNWRGFPDGLRVRDNWFLAQGNAGFDLSRGSNISLEGNHLFGPIDAPDPKPIRHETPPIPDPFAFPGEGVSRALEQLRKLPG